MNSLQRAEKWIISGRVQRVGFRYFAARSARRNTIQGAARNRFDGKVEIIAIGNRESLEIFCRDIQQGPPASLVSEIIRESIDLENSDYSSFDIIF